MGLIVIVIILIFLGVGFLTFKMFSIERVETVVSDSPDSPASSSGGEDDSNAEPEDESGEEKTSGELVNLFDYFDEENEPATLENADEIPQTAAEAATNEAANETANEAANAATKSASESEENESYYTASDRLTEFKSGRRYLIDCRKKLESAKDDGLVFCACYFDYDRFSYINSLKGNSTGDYVITQTSQHMRRIFPEGSLLTRVSCDHFSAVFPLTDMSQFDDIYDQLRRMSEKIRNDIAAKSGLRVCVGFASTDNDSSYDVSVLLNRANVARHCVKVTKAEKFEAFDSSMIETNFYGDSLMDTYTECQYGDDFSIYFETQVDLASDKVTACDSLVRWAYDNKPDVPITTDNGKIPTNNDKVIYHVCRSMSRWRKAGRESILVFVNVPVTDFFRNDIDEFIGKCLTEFQIEPASFVVKIDVSIVRLDWSACSKQAKKLRELGVGLCVSGIDTGYTNLEFLSGLSVEYLKLHKSFAHQVEKNAEQVDKCRKIVERANYIGARAIFEGVDNTDQVTALRSVHAKTVTGKYSGKPSTADELINTLPEHIERRASSDATVVLDDAQLAKGDFNLF